MTGLHQQCKPISRIPGEKLKIFAAIVAWRLLSVFCRPHLKSGRSGGFGERGVQKSFCSAGSQCDYGAKCAVIFPLTLPGETAAWYESTIYARVDGYVGQWNVDIGDHVKKGQVLATIETPDLDAQLAAAQAKLKASRRSWSRGRPMPNLQKPLTQRWKDSPKGVVSEQEREAKKAGYDSAVAQLNQAKAQVGLDQARCRPIYRPDAIQAG